MKPHIKRVLTDNGWMWGCGSVDSRGIGFFWLDVTQRAAYERWLTHSYRRKPAQRCTVCGTTKNLYKDGWYGYRCNSDECVPF